MTTQAIVNEQAASKIVPDGQFQKTNLDRWPFVKRANAMKIEGMLWYPQWKEQSTYIYPTRGHFHEVRPNMGTKVDHTTVVNGFATQQVDIVASGLQTGMSSTVRPWFKIGLEDTDLMEYEPVKWWLDEVQKRLSMSFHKSNTYGTLYNMYVELTTFGTACSIWEEDLFRIIRGRCYTAGEYYLGAGSDGRINALYRRYWMTIEQMVSLFGEENLSPASRALYRNNQPDVFRIVNFLVEENTDRVPYLKDYLNMPYRCVYWEDGAFPGSYLKLGGYDENVIIAPRSMTTTTADIYGKGSSWNAIGSTKMLQELEKNYIIAIEKKGNPPLQADASVQGEVNTLPGGVTRTSAQTPNAGVRAAYEVNTDLSDLREKILSTKDEIARFFNSHLFTMLINQETQGKERTAYEVAEMIAEKGSILGPLLDSIKGEMLAPLIERNYAIHLNNGLLPPPPKEIAGREIKIEFISILAQAQRMSELSAMDRWISTNMQIGAAVPSAMDIINFDEYGKISAEMNGVPAKIVNSPDKMSEIRKARAEEQQKQIQLQTALATADAAKKGAGAVKDMSQAPVGEGSALDGLMKTMKGS